MYFGQLAERVHAHELYDLLDRALVAMGNDYPAGYLLAAHAHRRAQLLYGATGVMQVATQEGK